MTESIADLTSKKGAGVASKLFDTFNRERKYDPFLDTDPVIQDSKIGMETLLSMCNAVEINSICGALGMMEPCTRSAKMEKVMIFIRNGGRKVEERFSEVLRLFWEGLLFEYLRSVGCPLRDVEQDPRHLVTRHWRRSLLDPSVRPGFVPYYLKREVKKRSSIMREDRDIEDIRARLLLCEDAVKEAETRMRQQHDYRFVLQYFSSSRELHHTLVANVNYLANEVEQLRAQTDHSNESVTILEEQLIELETKYDRVVGGLVLRGALQSTTEDTVYSMVIAGHANLRGVKAVARQLLANMVSGPEEYDSGCNQTKCPSNRCNDYSHQTARSLTEGVRKVEVQQNQSKNGSVCEGRCTVAQQQPEDDCPGYKAVANTVRANQRSSYSVGWDLGCTLTSIGITHWNACVRYKNNVAALAEQNARLQVEVAEANSQREKALLQVNDWEERYHLLKEAYATLEQRSKDDLTSAEEKAREGNRRGLEAEATFKKILKKATPRLVQMIMAYAPLDTEALGIDLCEKLGVHEQHFAHILAGKRMFEADLESHAFKIMAAEEGRYAAEATATEQEDTSTNKERGRPKSRGKNSRGAQKTKKSSKSRSKSASGKQQTKAGGRRTQGSRTPKGSKSGVSGKKKSPKAAPDTGDSAVNKDSASRSPPSRTKKSPSPKQKSAQKTRKKK